MSDLENTQTTAETFNQGQIEKLPFLSLLKRVGPGLILTGVVIGPGAVTTAAMIGSKYGYDLVWLYIPIIFMGIVYMMTTYRITLLTGMPTIHAIEHYYGKFAAKFVSLATFMSCFFFTIGNISGTGAGMNLLFNIDWKLGALLMIAVLTYCYFSKGVYSKVEKGVTLCILGMIFCFLCYSGWNWWSQSYRAWKRSYSLDFSSRQYRNLTGIYEYTCFCNYWYLWHLSWKRKTLEKGRYVQWCYAY